MINEKKALEIGQRVIRMEAAAMERISDHLDQIFIEILHEMAACTGKIIITGMGKSGHIARKMAATMSSLGISSFFLHPGEAMHGDLGMVEGHDLVIAISYSGESEEVVRIIPNIKRIGARMIGITSNPNSTLAKRSDIAQCFPDLKEACHLGLAPTTSTTAVLAYGDALAVALSELRGFSKYDFALYHPAGSLGKKLTVRVTDLMDAIEESEYVTEGAALEEAIVKLGKLGTDLLPVSDQTGRLLGIITNGDIERCIRRRADIYEETVDRLVHTIPVYVEADTMAVDALRIMMQHEIRSVPVVREERVTGIVSREQILKKGIYI